MSALVRLTIAGAVAALFSAPALAADGVAKLDPLRTVAASQQQACQGGDMTCDIEVTPRYCIAEDKCAQALPSSALVRYDQHMDALLQR